MVSFHINFKVGECLGIERIVMSFDKYGFQVFLKIAEFLEVHVIFVIYYNY